LNNLSRCISILWIIAWALAGMGKDDFGDGHGTSPPVPFVPHPNPPPRRGEGRVGVRRLEIFMQRLGNVRRRA
jgi:hypothetical protein